MSTKNIIDKFVQTSKNSILSKSYGISSEQLCPIFSVAGSISKTKSLVESGFEPTISELLIPHLILTFAPKLVANSLSHRFELAPKDLYIYFIGFFISTIAYSNSFIMFFVKEIPYVSKFFSLLALKNSTEDTFKLFSWNITCEIVGIFLTKLIMKKKPKLGTTELVNMIFVNVGILYIRAYQLNDYFIILVANIIPLSVKAIEYLRQKSKKKSEPKEEIYPGAQKKARRKASVASQLEKSK